MSLEYDQESSESESFDDLIDFQELRQNRIVEAVMKMKPSGTDPADFKNIVQDDAELIRGNANAKEEVQKQRKKEKQITEEQRKARELKILNARKYFQLAKLMYIQHVSSSIRQTETIIKNHNSIVALWVSLLSKDLLLQFMKYKKTKPLSMNIVDFLHFLKRSKLHIDQNYKKEQEKALEWNNIFWSVCELLKMGCRKVYFFSVDSIVEQTFFQLKYQTSEAVRKRENKKLKEHQIMKIKLSQQIQQNFQNEEDSSKYFLFEDYEFDEASFKNKSNTIKNTKEESNAGREIRRENNFIRKKNFKNHYFQIFDPLSNNWILVNSQILEVEKADEMKKLVLEGKFILSFYSTRIVHFKPEYEKISVLRTFKEVTIQDLTMFFEDNHRNLTSRRKRIGLKFILRHIFQESSFDKNRFMLQSYDQYLLNKNDSLELQYQLSIFPKNREEMLTSNYFIVPSLLPQYTILNQKAMPVPNIEFNEEKVYLRRDIIAVTSKVHWIDRGRKVKAGEIPVKKTENKSKNLTQLYLYEQTEPFSLDVDPVTGSFQHDGDFNSIYIPADFTPPPQMTFVREKVGVVCAKQKIRHSKIVQGFTRAGGKIVPNEIGYIIYKNDEQQVFRLHEQRLKKLEENKGKNRVKELTSLWNKLFKKIQLNEWSKTFQEK